MKFRICRASGSSYSKKKPCEGAYIYRKETNRSGDIYNYWAIDISTIDELLDLSEKEACGIVVDKPRPDTDSLPSIIIYDDYLE